MRHIKDIKAGEEVFVRMVRPLCREYVCKQWQYLPQAPGKRNLSPGGPSVFYGRVVDNDLFTGTIQIHILRWAESNEQGAEGDVLIRWYQIQLLAWNTGKTSDPQTNGGRMINVGSAQSSWHWRWAYTNGNVYLPLEQPQAKPVMQIYEEVTI